MPYRLVGGRREARVRLGEFPWSIESASAKFSKPRRFLCGTRSLGGQGEAVFSTKVKVVNVPATVFSATLRTAQPPPVLAGPTGIHFSGNAV